MFCIGILLTIWGGQIQGRILNGGFEISVPTLPEFYDDPNHPPPLDWPRETNNPSGDCYAGLHNNFNPPPADNGTEITWVIPGPYEDSRFVLLSTGDLGIISDRDIIYSAISQRLSFVAGDRLSGAYFFGTSDYMEAGSSFRFNDLGQIYLSPVDPNLDPNDVLLAESDVMTVGSYSSTEDWIKFAYLFDEQTAGEYDLICSVEDVGDTMFESYLAVDGLQVCQDIYAQGDLNQDCTINLLDFSILSNAWLAECPEPDALYPDGSPWVRIPADPNCPCEIADINQDWIVEPNDLNIMTSNWLQSSLY